MTVLHFSELLDTVAGVLDNAALPCANADSDWCGKGEAKWRVHIQCPDCKAHDWALVVHAVPGLGDRHRGRLPVRSLRGAGVPWPPHGGRVPTSGEPMNWPEATPFGFNWGPVAVKRLAHFKPRKERECYVVQVNGVDIYVSKTGRSVRVFRDGKELK